MANSEVSQRNNPSTMEDSDSDYERENIRPRGLTGLQNLGNTCYLNSALQSLSNCPPLTRYFLDCESLIRPEKSPMLSRSYLKLITELWHKKRPSYVVPSGIVSGIKAVHPMFRGFTQQDAQEFLRCLMDQLHEELKNPVILSDNSDDEDDEEIHDCAEVNANNTNNARTQIDGIDGASSVVGGRSLSEQKAQSGESLHRRPSFDSTSSQSELDYETCDSGLSSERSSNAGRDISSSDENGGDFTVEAGVKLQPDTKRSRKLSALSVSSGTEEYYTAALHTVANTKEMKETANLLERQTEMRKGKMYMEGGDSREQGDVVSASTVATPEGTTASKDGDAQTETKAKSTPIKSNKKKKKQNLRYDSIISQTFDGKILSSVRCLNCETVSRTKETFQDLSLPIPSKDHLHMLHSGYPSNTGGGVSPPKGGTCGEVNQGWLSSVLTWMKSWFIGPTVTLQDCLAAFFSADELKGDNMYSCGKCKKLRNGLKYSKVLELPEILSIHLKRFRHEFYSSKISTYISFPLEGLDMENYADKDCRNEVTTYDLVAVICHHGTAGGGHYTAYCLNHLNGQWYEFDDQYVTEVDVSQVQNCEAYVLFYRKSNKKIDPVRLKVGEILEKDERAGIFKFYISRQWLSRFHTFAEPGPITNRDFLCKHREVPPGKIPLLDHLMVEIPEDVWEVLYKRFGGGMVCNRLRACEVCENELERLKQRQRSEKELFIQLNEEFQDEEYIGPVYAISMAWFREWELFVREKTDTPPEAIDNSRIMVLRNGQPTLRQSSDHGHLSKEMWVFLHRIYGGGPEILFRQSTGAVLKTSNTSSSGSPPQTQQHHVHQQQNKPTLASLAAAASSASSSSSSSSVYPQMASSMSSSQGPSPMSSTSITVSSVSSSSIVASATEGTVLPSSSQEGPVVHSNSHSSQAESTEIQLRVENLDDTHTVAQSKVKKDIKQPQKQQQQDSQTDMNHQNPQKSPQAIVSVTSEDNKLRSETKNPSGSPSTSNDSETSVNSNFRIICNEVDSEQKSLTESNEVSVTASSENNNDSVSSGFNDQCSSSAAQESASTSTLTSEGKNITARLSRVSQDSGISSEASPIQEKQNSVVDKKTDNESSSQKDCADVKIKNPNSSIERDDVKKSAGVSAVGEGEKPSGGRGRNRRKKNKSMEVTRI